MILKLLLNTEDIYKNIEEYNLNKTCKILILFDDMSVCNFILWYQKVLNSTHYFVM